MDPKRIDLDDETLISLAPEYRRCVAYALLGAVGMPLIVHRVDGVVAPANGPVASRSAVICLPLAVACISILRWRLRVDRDGISRRRFLGWQLYSWDEFRSGRVEDGPERDSYLFPGRPAWHRKLSLGLLSEADRESLRSLIRDNRVCPPRLEPGDELGFRLHGGRTVQLGPDGVTIVGRGGPRSHGWNSVRSLKIRRLDRRRADFQSLELILGDGPITLLHKQGAASWGKIPGRRRPGPDEIASALLRQVPADRVVVTSLSERPRNIAERDDLRAILAGRLREASVLRWVLLVAYLLLVIVSLTALSQGWVPALKMLALSTSQWALIWLVFRHMLAKQKQDFDMLLAGPADAGEIARDGPG